MGIEDFNVDREDYLDSVLVLSPTVEAGAELGRLLEKRRYRWSHAESLEEAAKVAASELFDLLVLDERSSTVPIEDLLSRVQTDAALSRSAIIAIHPTVSHLRRGEASVFGERVVLLEAPLEPSAFLVKVATLLRLRKLKTEQAAFESRIASQNSELRDLNNRFRRELREAKEIQQSLFPKSLPTAPYTRFGACCMPLEAVGGDLYDIWKIDRGSYGLFIGDVTGHGLPAAFIGAMTKMALAYAPKASPDEMFAHMND
ncbi:MAG: SpoIIE family protein phosphatase, partial [Bdellovibrionales bacterium]|nr:SpoIIE family protein phosphatase [Bdellovibrionales bacterium]